MSRSQGYPGLMGNQWFTHKRKKNRDKAKLVRKQKQQQRRKGK